MTRRFAPVALLMGCVLLAASFAPAAEDYLKLVPEGALGVLVVNRPADVDARIQSLCRQMRLPAPSMLTMLDRFGVREGFDAKGTVALIVLPPDGDGAMPATILLVPIVAFDKIFEPFDAEKLPDEPVYKVHGFDEVFYARHFGGYAALTDAAHREALFRKNLKISPQVPAALAPWQDWLAASDAAALILRPGIKQVSAKVQEGIRVMKSTMLGANQQMRSMAAVFNVYAKMFQAAEREVAACGFGLKLDEQNTLRATSRTLLVPGGKWAEFVAQVQPAKGNLLAGLPEGPFVAAGGGVLSDAMMKAMMGFSMDLMKNMRELYGLSEEQFDEFSELSLQSIKGLRAMSMVFQAGRSADSLYSNMVCVMRVDDSEKFLERYEQFVRRYSEFVKGVDSPMLQPMEVEKSEVGGVAALQLTIKAPPFPGEMQSPQHEKMMELLFGPGGKVVGWLVPADKHNVVYGFINKDPIQRTIEAVKQGKPGLAGDAEVAKTAALLPADAVAVGYLSPSGMLDFVKRIMPAFAPPGAELTFPDFPRTPPVGFAVKTAPNEVHAHLVVPAEVIQTIFVALQRAVSRHQFRPVPPAEIAP